MTSLLLQLENLKGDERAIVETLLSRITQGRQVYGPWSVNDERNNPREALLEVIDALHYVAAELIRIDKEQERDVT